MTDRELFEKALEALEHLHRTGDTQVFDLCYAPELIPALKERLEQPQRTHWEGCEEVHPECKKQEQEQVVWVRPEIHPVMELRSKLRFRRMFRMR